jgi:hypothetical protein
MFQTKVVEKNKTRISSSITFPPRKSCPLSDNVEKCCKAGQTTDDNMAHAHCMLGIKGYKYTYKHTLRICNNFCFLIAAMVARTCLNVTLYLHWPSSWFLWLVSLNTRVLTKLISLKVCWLLFTWQYFMYTQDRYFLYEDASFYFPYWGQSVAAKVWNGPGVAVLDCM